VNRGIMVFMELGSGAGDGGSIANLGGPWNDEVC